MKLHLRFLAGLEGNSLQFLYDFFWEKIVQQLFIRHLGGVFNLPFTLHEN